MAENDNGHKSCRSHCCGRHGCKYNHDDCPVTMQQLEQDGPCQHCPSISEIQNELNHWKNEFVWWGLLQERKEKKKEQDVR